MGEKMCTRCKMVKPLNEYSFKNVSKNILKWTCKTCDKEVRKEFYERNKDKVKKKCSIQNKKNRDINTQHCWQYLKTHPCVDCGESDPIVLEFDHRDDVNKIDTISSLMHGGYKLEKVIKEIEKCDVRCSNCHKRRTAKQQGFYKHLKDAGVF